MKPAPRTATLSILAPDFDDFASVDDRASTAFLAKKIEIKDNQLTFEISGETDGNGWKVTYKGKPRGNSIKGTIDYEFGDNKGTVDFQGKRVAEKKEKEDAKPASPKKDKE